MDETVSSLIIRAVDFEFWNMIFFLLNRKRYLQMRSVRHEFEQIQLQYEYQTIGEKNHPT